MRGPGEGEPEPAESIRPGALSALLEDLVKSPEELRSGAWTEVLRPGVMIGRYELVREIGRGGFGLVWEAHDRELGRAVALKAVRPGARPDLREERLLREAEAAARLSHPNLVTLYDAGRTDGGPYLVLELLRGEPLARRLTRGQMALPEALDVAVQVARALAHAHREGVVHRDLTPGNVFLCHGGLVKVLDLGLAHAFGRRKADGGTPAYMAPEQWRGAPEDERTDVFALGIILFEMLTGERPFPDDGGRSVRGREIAPKVEVVASPALGKLVAVMLSKDPVARVRDGAAALSALEAIAAGLQEHPSETPPAIARRAPRPTPRRPRIPASVAVLPFADMSPGRDQEFFADGVAEEILNALTQLEGLHVIGRTSSFAFKGKNDDLRLIGQRLGVSSILEGSVRKDGSRVRITAELVNVADASRLWSKTFDRELTSVFAVQDEIARAVVDALQVKLMPGEEPSTAAFSTNNPEAHDQWLIGRHLLLSGSLDDSLRAVAVLKNAVGRDPAYAPAWAALAHGLGNLATRTRTREAEPLWREAQQAAEKAVEVGPRYGFALAMRGWLSLMHWDWRAARTDIERAISINPGDPEIRNIYGILLEKEGRLAEAVAEARRATELDPLMGVTRSNLGVYYTQLGDFGRARETFTRAMEVSAQNTYAAYELAMLDLLDGRAADALGAFEQEHESAFRLSGIAMAQYTLGQKRESDEALRQLVARSGEDAPYEVALVHAWRGERNAAFEWLERAYAQHDTGLRNVKVDIRLRLLRDDPRFAKLLRKMGLPAD